MSTPQAMSRTWPLILIIAVGLAWSWSSMGPGGSMPALEASVSEEHEPKRAGTDLPSTEKATVQSARVEADPPRSEPKLLDGAESIAEWRLHGQVHNPLGARVPQALVALISLHEGQPGNRGDREVVETDEYGQFSMTIPEWARGIAVLLVARRPGWQPHSELVTLTASDLKQPRELGLKFGQELSGRILRDGLPVAGARVSVDAKYGTGGVFGAGSEAWWAGGQLHEKHGHAESNADGFFSISGLGPYEHRLEIHAPAGDRPAIRGTLFAIRAPDSRTYDLSSAWLSVQILCPDGPIQEAKVIVSCAGQQVETTYGVDGVLVGVPPSRTASVVVEHRGARSASIEVQAPGAGQVLEVTVPIRIAERPSLSVRLPGATLAGVKRVQLRLQGLSDFSDTGMEAARGEHPDTFVVAMVPLGPGRYNLVLEPNGQGGSGRFVAPATTEIELPTSGTLEVELALEFFGRLAVKVHSSRQQDWNANYSVRDDNGHELLKRYVFHSAEFILNDVGLVQDHDISFGYFRFGGTFRWHEDADQAAARCGVIRPGTYTLLMESESHEPWKRSITISSGLTTEIEVHLVER